MPGNIVFDVFGLLAQNKWMRTDSKKTEQQWAPAEGLAGSLSSVWSCQEGWGHAFGVESHAGQQFADDL